MGTKYKVNKEAQKSDLNAPSADNGSLVLKKWRSWAETDDYVGCRLFQGTAFRANG